jgi:hypothetical protein
MRFLALVALAAGVAGLPSLAPAQVSAPGTVAAETAFKPVIELYTSQGCSSCPEADALLGRLAKRDDLIVLSFSVDYWDYLGWKDTLANPKFSERQRAYAKALGDGMVYTPQAVISGLTHVNGSAEEKIRRAIEKASKALAGLRVPVRLSAADGKLVIEAGAAGPGAPAKEATLWLAMMSASVDVPITRGENQGKTVTYYNVVRELIPVGMWNGKTMSVTLHRHSIVHKGTDRCAVLLQQGRAGPIVGAALLEQF